MGKKWTQKVEICYTNFTLPQNVAGYVHTSREPELVYTIQLISVYIKATYNILAFLKKSKRGIFFYSYTSLKLLITEWRKI